MTYVDICPPVVVTRIEQADLQSAEDSNLITWVEENSDRPCAIAALEAIAARLTADSNLTVIDLFCNAVASYAPSLSARQKAVIRAAYLRFPYHPAISFNYFLGLRKTGIDLREALQGRVAESWAFSTPRRDAETWDYHLYLAELGDEDALEALADKIARTDSGNDVTLMLLSLADVPGAAVDDILRRYDDDPRTADGVSGPGLPVAENVRLLLSMRGGN